MVFHVPCKLILLEVVWCTETNVPKNVFRDNIEYRVDSKSKHDKLYPVGCHLSTYINVKAVTDELITLQSDILRNIYGSR
jgi:hypothetical protein